MQHGTYLVDRSGPHYEKVPETIFTFIQIRLIFPTLNGYHWYIFGRPVPYPTNRTWDVHYKNKEAFIQLDENHAALPAFRIIDSSSKSCRTPVKTVEFTVMRWIKLFT